MAIKGMQHDRTGHIGPDTWKNDKQNQQRGSHEKGEQAAAAALGDTGALEDIPEDIPGNILDESPRVPAPDTKPSKGAR